MQVTFYSNTSDNKVVNKSLTTIKTVDCEAYKGFTVENPVMIVARDDSLLNVNYMYIPKLHRYYYCTVTIMNGRKMSVTGHVDVLKSFFTAASQSPCIADRCSDSRYYNKDITDDMILQKLQTTTTFTNMVQTVNPFSWGPGTRNYVLTLKGVEDSNE